MFLFQGRHTKTGQLAAIKVMDVTEVSSFICFDRDYHLQHCYPEAFTASGKSAVTCYHCCLKTYYLCYVNFNSTSEFLKDFHYLG
jgi:hypothetical protein